MAVFVACTGSLFAILGAHHVPSALDEITFVLAISGWVLVWTALCWMIYIAIKPLVRRRWPAMLMSWVRLFQGRVRDPRVGRDVLFGVLAGSCSPCWTWFTATSSIARLRAFFGICVPT